MRSMPSQTYVGHVIGGSFGLVFLLVNSGGLGTAGRVGIGVLSLAGYAVVVLAWVRTLRRGAQGSMTERLSGRYWLIVAAEAAVLFGGLIVIRRIEPAAVLGWIALIVGLHFLPLARLWPAAGSQLRLIGGTLAVLGGAGLVIGLLTSQAQIVELVAGVGAGIVLLGSAVIVAIRTLTSRTPRRPADGELADRRSGLRTL